MELVVVMTGQEIMVEEELMTFAQVVVYSAVVSIISQTLPTPV